MKLKKFQAESMPEALTQIRAELGSDAVILHTKEITTGGWFGFFAKKRLEVTAALDPTTVTKSTSGRVSKGIEPMPDKQIPTQPIVEEQVWKPINPTTVHESDRNNQPEIIQQLDREFEKQEVSAEIRTQLKEELFGYWYSQPKEKRTTLAVYQHTRQWLKKHLQDVKMGSSLFERKYMVFAGPTGVGKTTTIAKLAAEATLKHDKKVAILTTDTYRIAAIEQLKTYASILHVPIDVVYSMEDFHEAATKYEDYDLILVDTAGRNFTHDFYLKELQKTVLLSEQASLYLVLSLTSKYSDMKAVITQFKQLPVYQLIFTKKDETTTFGALINACLDEKLGIAFLTNGQNVPDDVLHADEDVVVSAVMEGIVFDGSS
ncbi:flagellar biosynthesis protein FlhF [Alkalicoccobacillus murimartini]|uniref:Flagellar biosynthesis protein FlhF n=1 Tax=Alkalicoccobacillus murimartini TaxID=171685 RepID=A0ABT9YFK7_9BACI|nr:flagellar biosynthesis protein FlhF [Alkalicoccobacillus murimartini]MDQ0206326.1 flagellar biosynthesis protein FlhF [Alkalicoccobacillus murimartini]